MIILGIFGRSIPDGCDICLERITCMDFRSGWKCEDFVRDETEV